MNLWERLLVWDHRRVMASGERSEARAYRLFGPPAPTPRVSEEYAAQPVRYALTEREEFFDALKEIVGLPDAATLEEAKAIAEHAMRWDGGDA